MAIKSFRRENDSRNCDDSILLSKIRGRTRENVRTGRSFFILEHETLVELIGLEPTTYGLQSRRSPD